MNTYVIKKTASKPVQKQHTNRTEIPDSMKTQYEALSGFSFDNIRVHYNSDKPAQLKALAYTQGSQVYIGPNLEQKADQYGLYCSENTGVLKTKEMKLLPAGSPEKNIIQCKLLNDKNIKDKDNYFIESTEEFDAKHIKSAETADDNSYPEPRSIFDPDVLLDQLKTKGVTNIHKIPPHDTRENGLWYEDVSTGYYRYRYDGPIGPSSKRKLTLFTPKTFRFKCKTVPYAGGVKSHEIYHVDDNT